VGRQRGRPVIAEPVTAPDQAATHQPAEQDTATVEVLKEACGVFGVYAPGRDVARVTFYGLYALQHRGQESAGIATSDGQRLHVHTDMGLVAQVFEESDITRLPGQIAIGHTRYSTTGSSRLANAQPILVDLPGDELALAHNGNLVNAGELRARLEEQGERFSSSTDSEVIARLIANAPVRSWEERLRWALPRVQGAYSLVMLSRDTLIAVRDPMGNRPLCIGRIDGDWVIASESCALDHIGAELVRDVEPGEAILIDADGLRSAQILPSTRRAFCIFEDIYFARPDSIIGGRRLYPMRMRMGAELAREHPVDADVVIGVPDTGTPAAIGYAQASGIPYVEGLIKNRYVNRTFIKPDQASREAAVQMKLNTVSELLTGKRVVVVDDSIVRGTTKQPVIALLRRAGAVEVHARICSPPIQHPCYFGVDMASRNELIAASKSVEEIRQQIGADSLGYLSLEGLIRATESPADGFCTACFTGDYPIPVQLELDKLSLERPERELIPLVNRR
jgi:amidophosphoribosyltransferase